MTTNELLELTMLHSLGMLEDDEREAYEAAFAVASPAVQRGIRAEARRMADLGDLMPERETGADLREMVLAAVRAAMHEQANEQRIAADRAAVGSAGAVAGRIHPGDDRAKNRTGSYAQPKLNRSPRVHRIWRATSMGLAAAVVALTVVTVNIQQTYTRAGDDALIAKIYDGVGGEFFDDTMFNPNTQHVKLVAGNPGSTNIGAAVIANPDWGTARLMVKNLRPQENNEPYRLVVLDANGQIAREITTFTPNGEVQAFDIKVNLSTESKLAIYQGMQDEISESEPLLTSVEM